ncbi:hypothetical protein PMIN01_02842 [Paraphaeosphaeria minitans]|uniref:Uncharacterized protein n=1 Tax=Paraphaeosphaeria minitans TaxID=565426 RepID=A0A9P6GQV3_9PLEO|nr:hypothetical protein PMIN01_02842 [Paraphaeosphaeria minitans]
MRVKPLSSSAFYSILGCSHLIIPSSCSLRATHIIGPCSSSCTVAQNASLTLPQVVQYCDRIHFAQSRSSPIIIPSSDAAGHDKMRYCSIGGTSRY